MKNFKIGNIEVPCNSGEETIHRNKKIPFNSLLVPTDISYSLYEEDEEVLETLALGVLKNKPSMLEGPKGTGKTSSVSFLAEQTNNPLYCCQLTGATSVDSFVGKWLLNSEGTFWQDGILTTAMKNGYWLLLDELNMAAPDILAVLNPVLDGRRVVYLDERGRLETDKDDSEWIIAMHPNFRLFGAINPSDEYAGTKELNESLKDRFSQWILTDYPIKEKEIKIIENNKNVRIKNIGNKHSDKGVVERMVDYAGEVRKASLKDNLISFELSTRNLIEWATYCDVLPLKKSALTTIVTKADAEDREKLVVLLDKHFADSEKC